MFDGSANGILGTTSNKIRVAYATKLIEPDLYADLMLINEIRNVFAHSLHKPDFSHTFVQADCSRLKLGSEASGVRPAPTNAKERFLYSAFESYFKLRSALSRRIMIRLLSEP
jgi:hypothetical protein